MSVCGPPATRKIGLLCLVTASSAAAAKRCVWSHTLWWKAAEEEEEHRLKATTRPLLIPTNSELH